MSALKWIGAAIAAPVAAIGAMFAILHATDDAPPAITLPGNVSGPLGFSSGTLLAVSDVDQAATAYGDGRLMPITGVQDTLSRLSIPANGAEVGVDALPVSNSVVGWPRAIDVASNGRYAYVIETRGTPPKSLARVESSVYQGLPRGGRLTTVALENRLRVVDTRNVALNPNTVAVRPGGGYLAVPSEEPGGEIVLVKLEEGVPAQRFSFPAGVSFGSSAFPGVRSLSWHPDGGILAGNISDRFVAFWRVRYGDRGLPTSLDPIGEPLSVGETLTVGAFHPSGRYYIIADVGWGENAATTDYLFNDPGELIVVSVAEDGRHEVSDRIQVGRSPEGWAMSPDGRRLVAVNMNRTYLPDTAPASWFPGRHSSSLSLIAFDAATGKGRVLDEEGFKGLLPEDAVFDARGGAVAVAVFHRRGEAKGRVELWDTTGDRLRHTGMSIPLARGVHGLARVPRKP